MRHATRYRPTSAIVAASPKVAPPTGLYAGSSFETDACGVALIANLKGKPTHETLRDATIALARMEHRGGCGCEPNTGDGAGILLGMPDGFMRNIAAKEAKIAALPDLYASGLVFASHDEGTRSFQMKATEETATKLGLKVLGWRKPRTNNSDLGSTALASEPYILQVFAAPLDPSKLSGERFEKALILLRKQTARHLREARTSSSESFGADPGDFYVASLSAKTITYKGQLTSGQLPEYYLDLKDSDFKTHMAMVHSRFSTNTFPSWDRAQPNRMLCHNGEINTLRGNRNWIASRMASMEAPHLSSKYPGEEDLAFTQAGFSTRSLAPFTSDDKTDSGNLDAVLELLVRGSSARTLPEAMMLMVPEAWQSVDEKTASRTFAAKRDFYRYNSCVMEPWDGPAMMAFTDGKVMGAILDRNGLRPSRYYVTHDDRVLLSSEVGVLPELDPGLVKIKGRLEPGKMFLVDFDRGEIVLDEELKAGIASKRPYGEWLAKEMIELNDWVAAKPGKANFQRTQAQVNKALNTYGYTTETMEILLRPMAETGKEALGSMGIDLPLATLSRLPQLPFAYFKQLFAQVTNPPIDPIREEIVMSLACPVGPEANILSEPSAEHCSRLMIQKPILSDEEMATILASSDKATAFDGKWFSTKVDCSFDASKPDGLKTAIQEVSQRAVELVKSGVPIIVLSNTMAVEKDSGRVPIPSLLITGAVHHALIKQGLRTRAALMVQAGDAREVHDFCTLVGYGADAIHPEVAYRGVEHLANLQTTPNKDPLAQYRYAAHKGMLKVMAKMGISTLQSYKGAQIFECVGMDREVVDLCFPGTASRIEGATFTNLQKDAQIMFERGRSPSGTKRLHNPGDYHLRDPNLGGEVHYNSAPGMAALQTAARLNSLESYKVYAQDAHLQASKMSLRGLLAFDFTKAQPIALNEVEPASEIVKRFCTGAMSLGSISIEAHETLALAMNSMNARSNTGEGGEDPARFTWKGPNGESKRSAIKQIASGRFGVTSHYLTNADQLQIKMAQGAKPGEGGELPGAKVTKQIAAVRGTTPGVGLISPPPHHDIYSIEDLAQLIHDLKSANPSANVSVKLVSEVGVGVVAAGCAKAKADHITISGGDGGTGAAAWTGVHKAGLPWELGLAEAQQTLVLNDLRSRVTLQTDGQIKTGRDAVVAALLGAEEVAFSTAPLIAMGCIMMRKCHLNTCPVGIATQDPELRAKFAGQPEHVVNYLFFLAEEMRELMAKMGFATWGDMVGQSDRLMVAPADTPDLWTEKTRQLNLEHLLFPSSKLNETAGVKKSMEQDHRLDEAIDNHLIARAMPALESKGATRVDMSFPVSNLDRSLGAMLSYEISRRYGKTGLPDDCIRVQLQGNCGQSLGFALARGVTIDVRGDANDYVGKSLSGGKIVVRPPEVIMNQGFKAEDNVIVGNVCLYGASSGEAFFRGKSGERFAVRNSGARAVVEGCGDHGCEYMTGGSIVVLGETGRNFAAGMSGGIAFIYAPSAQAKTSFEQVKLNPEMVRIEAGSATRPTHQEDLRDLLERHLRATGSSRAQEILSKGESLFEDFIVVVPNDYERVMSKEWDEQDAFLSRGR